MALVAYNAHRFDAPVLLAQLDRFGIDAGDVVDTFVDPYVFVVAHQLHGGFGRRQADLMARFGVDPAGRDAHNAVNDAENLRRLSLAIQREWPGLLDDRSDGGSHFLSARDLRDKIRAKR